MRLGYDALASLPSAVERPRRKGPPPIGIVHFGPGAFHRAHQAAYIDRLLDQDGRWGIAAVSLRSRETVDALAAQDGLYTLAIRDAEPCERVIGAHGAWLGPEDSMQTLALLAAPTTRLVTMTVTEKGYCLAADGTLDLTHHDIVHDLRRVEPPRSVIGWLVAGMAVRRSEGTQPFVVMPCDNLAGNGAKVRAAMIAYAQVHDQDLSHWIADTVRVPATMVDAITPASDVALLARVRQRTGVEDAIPVQRESFAQWVIEDIGPFGPDLAGVGAIVTPDVASFERMKLRILNGAHSTLAYAGLLRGRQSVAEAIADAPLASFVERLIRDEVVPTLPRPPGLDLGEYTAAVLARFANPAIVHRLEQIAQDGTQKLPYRLADTLATRRAAGAPPGRVAAAIGCWIAFLIRRTAQGTPLVDPLATTLAAAATGGDPATTVQRLLEDGLLLGPELARDHEVHGTIVQATESALAGQWSTVFAGGHLHACS